MKAYDLMSKLRRKYYVGITKGIEQRAKEIVEDIKEHLKRQYAKFMRYVMELKNQHDLRKLTSYREENFDGDDDDDVLVNASVVKIKRRIYSI